MITTKTSYVTQAIESIKAALAEHRIEVNSYEESEWFFGLNFMRDGFIIASVCHDDGLHVMDSEHRAVHALINAYAALYYI